MGINCISLAVWLIPIDKLFSNRDSIPPIQKARELIQKLFYFKLKAEQLIPMVFTSAKKHISYFPFIYLFIIIIIIIIIIMISFHLILNF